jgi:hypothetical protein
MNYKNCQIFEKVCFQFVQKVIEGDVDVVKTGADEEEKLK